MIVVRTAESAEQALTDGQLACPRRGCGHTLQRWGYGRRRHVRSLDAEVINVRPRRVRCGKCETTHVLLPAALQPHRADATEVIGTALAHKAAGMGHRRIATALGRSPSTVRRWLRRARDHAHLNRLWQRGAQELIRLDADTFNQLTGTGNLLRDALTMLAAAALVRCGGSSKSEFVVGSGECSLRRYPRLNSHRKLKPPGQGCIHVPPTASSFVACALWLCNGRPARASCASPKASERVG